MQLKFFFVEDTRYLHWEPPNYPVVPLQGTKIRDDAGGPVSMADDADQRFSQTGIGMVAQGPTEYRDVPFLGPPDDYTDPFNQTGGYWIHDYLDYDLTQLIQATFVPALFSGGHIGTVLLHRAGPTGLQAGFFSAETKLCFIGYDKWYPGVVGEPAYPYWGSNGWQSELTPDARGRDSTRERVFSHELGHALLPVRNRPPANPADEVVGPPVNGWAGGHDFGPAPKDTDALMRKHGPKGKWLRHEDWKTAIEETKARMGL